jgi:hypothetical protein
MRGLSVHHVNISFFMVAIALAREDFFVLNVNFFFTECAAYPVRGTAPSGLRFKARQQAPAQLIDQPGAFEWSR